MRYVVRRAKKKPELQGLWTGPAWQWVEAVELSIFRPESSDHRPRTRAKLLYDPSNIYGIFHVLDRYVRSVETRYQGYTCRDSCVEFFVKPDVGPGYFNFEWNCGGTMLVYYVTDTTRRPDGEFRGFIELPKADGDMVAVYHSMPAVVEPEIKEPTEWTLEFRIPFALIEKYAGPLGNIPGQEWRANFYKCGDRTSHPHWASWSPVEKLDFHLPHCFGTIEFEK